MSNLSARSRVAAPHRSAPLAEGLHKDGSGYAKQRNLQIDTVRGLACLLLVAFHMVGETPQVGMRFPAESWVWPVMEGLSHVRMPLFTLLSGIVYAARPVRVGGTRRFLHGKALRLLLPLVCVGLLFAVVQNVTPGTNRNISPEEMLLIPFFPYAHFWFVQALSLIFALIVPLERLGALATLQRSLLLWSASWLLLILRESTPDFFAFSRALYLLPFFLAGVILVRFGSEHRRARPALLILPIVGLAGALLFPSAQSGMLGITLGTVGGVLLVTFLPFIPFLARIGFYSYTIYLFHVFGTASARIVLSKVGAGDSSVFVTGMFLGVGLPIALHLAAQKVPYVSRMLLGVKAQPAGLTGIVGPLRKAQRSLSLTFRRVGVAGQEGR